MAREKDPKETEKKTEPDTRKPVNLIEQIGRKQRGICVSAKTAERILKDFPEKYTKPS